MPFIARAAHLLVKFPQFTATATEVTPPGDNCDQGLLWFFEECNSVYVALL